VPVTVTAKHTSRRRTWGERKTVDLCMTSGAPPTRPKRECSGLVGAGHRRGPHAPGLRRRAGPLGQRQPQRLPLARHARVWPCERERPRAPLEVGDIIVTASRTSGAANTSPRPGPPPPSTDLVPSGSSAGPSSLVLLRDHSRKEDNSTLRKPDIITLRRHPCIADCPSIPCYPRLCRAVSPRVFMHASVQPSIIGHAGR